MHVRFILHHKTNLVNVEGMKSGDSEEQVASKPKHKLTKPKIKSLVDT